MDVVLGFCPPLCHTKWNKVNRLHYFVKVCRSFQDLVLQDYFGICLPKWIFFLSLCLFWNMTGAILDVYFLPNFHLLHFMRMLLRTTENQCNSWVKAKRNSSERFTYKQWWLKWNLLYHHRKTGTKQYGIHFDCYGKLWEVRPEAYL